MKSIQIIIKIPTFNSSFEIGTGSYTNLKTVVETLLNPLSQNIPTIKGNTSFLEESFSWKAQYNLQSGLGAMFKNELKKVNQAKIYENG